MENMTWTEVERLRLIWFNNHERELNPELELTYRQAQAYLLIVEDNLFRRALESIADGDEGEGSKAIARKALKTAEGWQ